MDRPDFDPPVIDEQSNQLTPPLWAHLIQDSEFVPGYDLHPGDTIFLTNRAYPRIMWTQLSRASWSVLVQQDGRHFRSAIDIDPQQHYVVKRATKR